jgi:hypothetical protein
MIRYEQLINIIAPKGDINQLDDLIGIFLEYCKLKELLANPEKQTWYFKKGIASHESKAKKLEDEWAKIRNFANQTTVDELILAQKNCEVEITKRKAWGSSGFMKSMVINNYQNKINEIVTALEIKAKVKELQPIEYYFDHYEEIMEVFGS